MKFDRDFRKKLHNYIAEKKKKRIPTKTIKHAFVRRGYTKKEISTIFHMFFIKRFVTVGSSILLATFLFSFLFFQANIQELTFAASTEKNHRDNLNLIIESTMEYNWTPQNPGDIKTVEVSGKIPKTADTRISLHIEDREYKIFSSENVEKEIPLTIDTTPETENSSLENATETKIKLSFQYEKSKGIVDINQPVSFSVADTTIDENLSEQNLCTVYIIESIETDESQATCFGSENCCAFANVPAQELAWDDQFDITIGTYGATNNNKITAQVLYVDYNLSVEDPFTETYVSEQKTLPAQFYDQYITFENECIETCDIDPLKNETYRIMITTNDTTQIDAITYTVQTQIVENSPPVVTKNFTNLSIEQGNTIKINLSKHFLDPDNTTLYYTFYNSSNMNVEITNTTATITPATDFIGTDYMFFIASDLEETATSNIFDITVEKNKQSIQLSGTGLKSLRSLIGLG